MPEFVPGMWCYVELPAKDPARARKFYSEVFGWTFQDWPEMGFAMYLPPGGGVGGGIVKAGRGVPRHPVSYVLVRDLDRSVHMAESRGGKVVKARTAVAPNGWYVHLADPDGNVFGLWQPAMMESAPSKKKR